MRAAGIGAAKVRVKYRSYQGEGAISAESAEMVLRGGRQRPA